jgi:hypothetical protein
MLEGCLVWEDWIGCQLELAKGIVLRYVELVHKSLVRQRRPLVHQNASYVEGKSKVISGKLLAE